MTNEAMVYEARVQMMNDGLLHGVMVDGEEVPEELYTFDEWKKQGRIVKKGEHAVKKMMLWTPNKKTQKMLEDNDGKLDEKQKKQARMYLRLSSLFTEEQTEPAADAERKYKERAEKRAEAKKTATKKTVKAKSAKAPKKAETKSPEPKKAEKVKKAPKKAEAKKTAKTPKKAADKKSATPAAKSEKSDTPFLKKMCEAFTKATLKKNPSRFLLLERYGNKVYICDSGWYLAVITLAEYNAIFRKRSIFPKLEAGACVRVEDKDKSYEYKKPFVKNCLDSARKDKRLATPAKIMDYTEEVGSRLLHAVKCGKVTKAVNDEFLKAVDNGYKWFSGEDIVSAVWSAHGCILPVRVDEKFGKNAEQ